MENSPPILIHTTDSNYGEYIKSLVNQFGIQNTVLTSDTLTWNRFTKINPQLAIFETNYAVSPILIKAIKKQSFPLIVISQDDIPAIRGMDTPNEPFLIGNTKEICEIRNVIARISKTDLTVLILGETGTGKGLVASAIHNNSMRRSRPFLQLNCANIPSSLFESELFGYKKGAFTGAWEDKPGKFNIADSGTIFLDEISEMPLSMQAKILQVLQEQEFSPIGGIGNAKVNVRIIAATNTNPIELIEGGRLRQDLYYRLNVINIVIPSLKKRKEDISLLKEYLIEKYCLLYNKKPVKISRRLCHMLTSHDWPGNVRELENIIKNVIALENENLVIDELKKKRGQKTFGDNLLEIRPEIYDDIGRVSLKAIAQKVARQAEENVIQEALNVSGGNKKKAAKLLEISYKSMLNKIKGYGL
jgi:two-component system response regulator AtoC